MASKIKRGRGRQKNERIHKLAAEAQVTIQQARTIEKQAEECGISTDDLKTVRLRKVKLECDRIEYLLAVTKGHHVPKDSVEEEGIALGMAVKAQLLAWTGSLPGRLEGLTAAKMVPILQGAEVRGRQSQPRPLQRAIRQRGYGRGRRWIATQRPGQEPRAQHPRAAGPIWPLARQARPHRPGKQHRQGPPRDRISPAARTKS